MANGYVIGGVVAGIGILLTATGCILIPVFDDLVENTIVESAEYANGSDGYDNFVNSSSPTFTSFYFFNLTNMDEVLNNGAKPRVEEIGPYVYRVVKPKNSLQYLEGQSKIEYKSNTTYTFEEEMSEGNNPLTDKVTNVNLILLAAAKLVNVYGMTGPGSDLESEINSNNEEVFDTFTVDELLWGYTDTTMESSGNIILKGFATNGLFYESNETQSNPSVVFTGIGDIDLINEVDTWKGLDFSSYEDLFEGTKPVWTSDTANMLNGTDGTQYKPFLEKDSLLYTFSTDLCRSFVMLYDSEQDVKGINTYRFVLDPENFAVTPENVGFCVPNGSNCFPEGLLNAINCFEGTPIVASLPHFYLVDETVRATIEGMNPVKELHETAIDVEPNTGISLRGNKRFQINYYIEGLQYFPGTNDPWCRDGFVFPVMWLNEASEINSEDAETFKSEVIGSIELLEIVQYSVIGVGAFVVLVGLVVLASVKCRKKSKDWD